MDVDGRGHAQGSAHHQTRQSAVSRHEMGSNPVPMPLAPLAARDGLARAGHALPGMSQAPLPEAFLDASLRRPAAADGAWPAQRADAWFAPFAGADVPRIRVSDLEPRDGVPSASYLRAVETFSAGLRTQGAAVLEPNAEDSVLFQCALESAQLFFQRTGGTAAPEEGIIFRAGENLCASDACLPPSADKVFSRMGGIARIALAAVARGLALPQESVLGSVDSCPLQLGEASSSILSVSALHYQQRPQRAGVVKPLRKSRSRTRKSDVEAVKSPSTASASEAEDGTPRATTALASAPDAALRSPEGSLRGTVDGADVPQFKEEPTGSSLHPGTEPEAGVGADGAAGAAGAGLPGLRPADGDSGGAASAGMPVAQPESSLSPPRQAAKAAPLPELTPPGLLLLVAADSPGLEVKDAQGQWKCIDKGLAPGSVLVLLGERLAQASSSNCTAALYRVAVPSSAADPGSPLGFKSGVPGKTRDWRSHFFSRHALSFHLMPRGSTAESESLGAASALATHSSVADPESVAQAQASTLLNANPPALPPASAASLATLLKDPLSGNLMDDAMVAPCGHTFGGEALRRIMGTMLCVYCKQPLGPLQLVPNLVVRAVVAVLKQSKGLPSPSGTTPAARTQGSPTLPFHAKKHQKKLAVVPSQGSPVALGLVPADPEETRAEGVQSRGVKAADALFPDTDMIRGPSTESAGAAVELGLRGPDDDEEDGEEDEEELPIGERGMGLTPSMRHGWGAGGLKAVKRRKDKDSAPVVVARDGGVGCSSGREEKQGESGMDPTGSLRVPVKKANAAGSKPKSARALGAAGAVGSGPEASSSPFSPEREGASGGAAASSTRLKGVQFPFSVNDHVLIKGNKRTPEKFVGREAVITSQCLNGWYLVRTLDTGESVRLQYRSLQRSEKGRLPEGSLPEAPRPAGSVGLLGPGCLPKRLGLLPAQEPRGASPSASGLFSSIPVFPSLSAPISLPPSYTQLQQGVPLAGAALPASVLEAGLQCDSEGLGPEVPGADRAWLEEAEVAGESAGEAVGADALCGMRLGPALPSEQGEGDSQRAEDAAALTLSMFPSAGEVTCNQAGPVLLQGVGRCEDGASVGLVELSLAVAAMGKDQGGSGGSGLSNNGAMLDEVNPPGVKTGIWKGATASTSAASAAQKGLLSLRVDHDQNEHEPNPVPTAHAADDTGVPSSGTASAGQEVDLAQNPFQLEGEEGDVPQALEMDQFKEGPVSLKLKLLGKGAKGRPLTQECKQAPSLSQPVKPQGLNPQRYSGPPRRVEASSARASSPPPSAMMPPKKRDFALLMGKAGSSSSTVPDTVHPGSLHEHETIHGDTSNRDVAGEIAAVSAALGSRGLAASPAGSSQDEPVGKAVQEDEMPEQEPKRRRHVEEKPEAPTRVAAASVVSFGIAGKAPGTCASDQDASTGSVMRSAHVQVQCPDESA